MRRALAVSVAIATVSLGALGTAAELPTRSPTGGSGQLHLRLEPLAASFATARDVRLRVLITNSESRCRTQYFDRIIAGDPSSRRPISVLTLSIHREDGGSVARGNHSLANWGAMNLRDLIHLDCWEFFGREIMPESAEWGFRLHPGKYRIGGRLEIRVRSYLQGQQALLRSAAELAGKPVADFLGQLADEVLLSDEVAFEVRGTK
jgi:hypothetical protein